MLDNPIQSVNQFEVLHTPLNYLPLVSAEDIPHYSQCLIKGVFVFLLQFAEERRRENSAIEENCFS